jgi:hypothetical protein
MSFTPNVRRIGGADAAQPDIPPLTSARAVPLAMGAAWQPAVA